MSVTRVLVWFADGPLLGMTVMIAVSPAGFVTGGVTATTSSSAGSCRARACVRLGDLVLPLPSTTIVSGPLNPGPKPSASRS